MNNRYNPSAAVTCALALLTSACVSTGLAVAPDALRPASNEAHAMTVAARGVQIYECRTTANGAAPAWAFVAPEAELYDAHGRPIGHHGAGPSWQAADGSRIVGALKARAEAPAAGAIPWLLLSAQAIGAQGTLSRVTSIQRVNTVGGAAPAAGCTRDSAGATARVAYTADYHFFSPR